MPKCDEDRVAMCLNRADCCKLTNLDSRRGVDSVWAILRGVGIGSRRGVSFYSLRHTFASVALLKPKIAMPFAQLWEMSNLGAKETDSILPPARTPRFFA